MKVLITLMVGIVVAAMVFAGYAVAAELGRPANMSEEDWLRIKDKIDPSRVQWNPYKGLAKKKDGSPFKILDSKVWIGDDYQTAMSGIAKQHLESAGAAYTVLSCEFNPDKQVSMFQDAVATRKYDAIICHPMEPAATVPAIEAAIKAGIDVYCYVDETPTPMMTGYAGYHYQDENLGVTVIGQEFVKVAKKLGHTKENPFVILELWGIHGIESLHHRHNGFHKGLGNSPLVKVIESSDTMIQPQKMFNAIIDGFTKHPEIKGLYPQTGDANAIVEGLRAVDRLVPEGDPKHVYVITNDVDKVAINALRKGWFHAVGGTESWHQIDIVIKQLLWHTVLGQPLQDGDYRSGKVKLPRKVVLDIPLITKDNIDAKEVQLYGGTIVFTDMPMGRWDLWPVLDTSSIGLPTPALADRMRLKGY